MTIGFMLKSLLVVAVAAYAVVVAVMFFAQRSLLYPGASRVSLPASAPWGEWVEIATPDGEKLAALHSPPDAGRPTILLFGGNGDSIANYGFLAEALGRQGHGMLAPSYRGYPGSTGTPSETGLLVDGLAAFDWLSARDDGPIVLLGRSLGSGVAVNTAAEREAAGLVLVSPFLSVQAIASSLYPYLPVGLLIRDSFRSDLRIAGVAAPKLFLHGDRDGTVPLASGQALFEIAVDPKRFSVHRGLGHNDIFSPDVVAEIVAFADEMMLAEPPE
jgi:hypothetical protein